jgi:hypothetical protein
LVFFFGIYFIAADLVCVGQQSSQKSPYSKTAAFYISFCFTLLLYNLFQNRATGQILGILWISLVFLRREKGKTTRGGTSVLTKNIGNANLILVRISNN